MKKELLELKEAVQNLTNENESLEAKNEELKEQIKSKDEQINSLKAQISEAKEEVKEITEDAQEAIDPVVKMEVVEMQLFHTFTGEEEKPQVLVLPDAVVGKKATKVLVKCKEGRVSQNILGDHKTATLKIAGFDPYISDKDVTLVGNNENSPVADNVHYFEFIELQVLAGTVLSKNVEVSLKTGMTCNPYLKFEFYFEE